LTYRQIPKHQKMGEGFNKISHTLVPISNKTKSAIKFIFLSFNFMTYNFFAFTMRSTLAQLVSGNV